MLANSRNRKIVSAKTRQKMSVARTGKIKPNAVCRMLEYASWSGMKDRCLNENNRRWRDYGGRGIKVCERWQSSFAAFLEDMGARPSPQHTLDRIDNDGNYEPGNCRWALVQEQARNRSSNVIIEYGGKSMCLVDWAEHLNINDSTLRKRLDRGWTVKRAFAPVTEVHTIINAPILRFDAYGNLEKRYPTKIECAADGFNLTLVDQVCKGTRKAHQKKVWRYEGEFYREVIAKTGKGKK